MPARQVTLAKLSRPRMHDVLVRTRLHALLDEAAKRPFVWVCAQPGAGKTTLVADWLQANKRGGIWYQVDAADGDPASFVYHLQMAAGAFPARKGARALPLLTAEYLRDLAGFARRFFRELFARIGSGATLVLDNFQEAGDDAALHRLMVEMAAEVPQGINIVVISRSEPAAIYAPLVAYDSIAIVDGSALRFSLDETAAIAGRRGFADTQAIGRLHERSNGWAAGLTLLLARSVRQGGLPDDDDADSLQHVFGYFAQRVFDAVLPGHQRALMELALLPRMTPELAQQLTGLPDAARLLEQLHRQHMFTDMRRVGGAQPRQVYQFHALFRTFLQHRAREVVDAAEWKRLAARAGTLLDAAGEGEAALPLFAEGGDWDSYARVIAQRADTLIGTGRRKTVRDWLAAMPAGERDRHPWLGYWHARAHVLEPQVALQAIEQSWQRFQEAGDVAGQVSCGGAAVHILYFARLGWSEVMPWVERLEPLLRERTAFPTPALELSSYSAIHAALTFCRPEHPAIPGMARRLLALVDDEAVDWTPRLTTATHLLTYLHNAGEDELVRQLMGRIDPVVDDVPASTLSRSFWYTFRAIHDMRNARYEEASARFQRAEDLAVGEGLGQAEYVALQFRTYLDTVFRHVDDAQARIARMERHPARGSADAEMNYWLAQTLVAQARGEAAVAHAHAQRTLAAIEQVGAAFFRAIFPPLVASAFADVGEFDAALALVAQARERIRGTYLEVVETQLLLEEAYVEHRRGDDEAVRRLIARALKLALTGSAHAAYAHRVLSRQRVLLEIALKAGIETDFVRGSLRMWRYPPPAEEIAQWPWPVRVRTLGAFEVRVDDIPIEFGRKAPKKTLALLKAVIARGGSTPEAALIDTFWPDEAGDAAVKSLAAAVHRLRGLLGDHGDVVIQQGGQVALDRQRVWVDSWSFERLLSGPRDTVDPDSAQQVLELYRGAFLAEEEGEAWPVPMRERLRSRFIHAVGSHAARLESQRRYEEAVAWYLRGLDADAVVEPFYQGLMRCYHRLDRMPEAVSAYRRLKQMLSVTLNLAPSAATEKLYQSLRLGAANP